MKRPIIVAAATAVLVGSLVFLGVHGALAQHQPGEGMQSSDVARHFIEQMIPHHEDAVTMADLALTQSEHPEIQALAGHIKQVQTDEIAQMRQWYQDWYGIPVAPATSMMSGMGMGSGHATTTLDGAQPFDKALIEQMIPHHQMAVMMSSMARSMVIQPELRTLLDSIVTSQSAEIEQMRGWYVAWYGVPVPATMTGHTMMPGHQMPGGMGPRPMGSASVNPMDTDAGAERQKVIREDGSSVMPFDLNQTLHHFVSLPDGGMQMVTVNDLTNQTQIALVQQHLASVAARFQQGDFSAPAALHGASMPGLSELSAAAGQIEIVYSERPDGGEIRYRSENPDVIDAIHRWFSAQMMDRGQDAVGN